MEFYGDVAMPKKTKPELAAENLTLQARLAQVEAELARRPPGESTPSRADPAEHRRVEEALKISEVRYRRLFQTAKDGILILDGETGRIIDSNPFLEQMLGYSHAELSGKRLWEIGPFKDAAASESSFRELQRKRYIRYEDLPLETKGGQRRQVEFVSNLYRVDSKKVIQCNVRDITARKMAESMPFLVEIRRLPSGFTPPWLVQTFRGPGGACTNACIRRPS